jgi:hypothetical protein
MTPTEMAEYVAANIAREDARKAALQAAYAGQMKALVGTEKQIAWAEKIRAQFLYAFELLVTTLAPETREAVEPLRSVALNQSKAAFWIDRRDHIVTTGSISNAVMEMITTCRKSSNEGNQVKAKAAFKALLKDEVGRGWA